MNKKYLYNTYKMKKYLEKKEKSKINSIKIT